MMTPEMHLIWATPLLIFAAILIGWAAETAQIYISQGLALAILAWLQTLPEFAVEALIAWQQKQDLIVANLTGSLRLLAGFGWPMIFLIMDFSSRRGRVAPEKVELKLPSQHGLEVAILLVASIYFGWIAMKASFTLGDAIFLFIIYFSYLWQLSKMPAAEVESEEDLPWIGQKITKMTSPGRRTFSIIFIFVLGGVCLQQAAHPFLEGLEGLALKVGISSFFFVQWIAPFVSEFPEKVTAFGWARTVKKAPLALLNMISSNIVQWTLMAGMVSVIFCISKGAVTPIFFSRFQVVEISLTVAQSLLTIAFLMDLKMNFRKSITLLSLWLAQFVQPHLREEIIIIYFVFFAVELMILQRQGKLLYALREFRERRF